MNDELSDLRSKLDELDKDICDMLHFRMVISEEIHRVKHKLGLPIEDLNRETEVLEAVKKRCQNPIIAEKIKHIFQMLIDCAKINGYLKTIYDFPFKRVGIIGWGLMGGSMAKWIKGKNKKVKILALEHPCIDLELAKEDELIEELCFNMDDFIDEIELLILAVPLTEVIPLAKKVAAAAKKRSKPLVIMDISSVKKEITEEFEKLTHPLAEFISTHPMAGSEKQGFVNSDATLLYKAPWIVIPHAKNKQETLDKIRSIIVFYGANPVQMDSESHDRQTALISHLPGQISLKYLQFVEGSGKESLDVAGSGFKSFTRIANSNPTLRKDIAHFNKAWLDYYQDKWIHFEKGK